MNHEEIGKSIVISLLNDIQFSLLDVSELADEMGYTVESEEDLMKIYSSVEGWLEMCYFRGFDES